MYLASIQAFWMNTRWKQVLSYKSCKILACHSANWVGQIHAKIDKRTGRAINTVNNKHTGFSEGPHFTFNSNDPGISERFQTLKSLTKTPPGTQSSNTISETSVFRTDRHTVELNCTVIFCWLILVAFPCLLSTRSPRTLAEKLSFPLTWKISVTFVLRRFKGSVDAFCLAICTAHEVCQQLQRKWSLMVLNLVELQSLVTKQSPWVTWIR